METTTEGVVHSPCAILYINLNRASKRRQNIQQEIARVFPRKPTVRMPTTMRSTDHMRVPFMGVDANHPDFPGSFPL